MLTDTWISSVYSYLCFMSKKNKDLNGKAKEDLSPAEIAEWLKKDLATSIAMLNMLYTDQDLLNHVADFCYGRVQNAKHKEELKAQIPD